MDLQTLVGLFDSTLHPEPEVRQDAEQQLQQLEARDGFLSILLQMISSADMPLGTKQAASIYFKNRVRRSWSGNQRLNEQHPAIGESDRSVTRENILGAIYAAPQAIKLQLTECLGIILKNDFPDKWPQFIVHVKELLHVQDAQKVYTGLLALLEVIKVYRFSQSKREIIDELAKELLPQVQKIADEAVASDDELAMRMAWISLKSYYNTIQAGLPVSLQEPGNLVAWGTTLIKMIEKPVAFDKETVDEETAKEPVWKAKKWAVRSINRLYRRYGNPALLASTYAKQLGAFAKLFTANFLPQILQVYLKQIEGYTTGQTWMSMRIRGLVSQMLSDCIKEKTAWKLLKPHVEGIVSHFIFPQLCFSEADQELWEDNPVEYVQKRVDPLDDFGSASLSASNLLIDLAVDRKKATLNIILNFVNGVLATYSQSAPEARDPRAKDGALAMMGALCGTLCSRKSPVYSTLPSFLLTHVVPEFTSTFGFLRARALDTYCRYSSIEFSDPQITRGIFESVLGLLNDSQLPVRVHAALALQPMIENEVVRDLLASHLPQVMQVFLNLTNEIDSDTITHVIDEFVEVFADRMSPFAVQLCQQLCDTFTRVMEDVNSTITGSEVPGDIDEMTDKTMAAMGVLKTIGTLVLNLESSPEVVYKLEEVVFPVIRHVLDQRMVDLYDEVYEILDCCMYAVKAVSPNAWNLFTAIYQSFKSDGIDFIEEMLPSLDNYVTFGMDVVGTNNNVQAHLFDIIETVMKSDRVGESDRICACKLAQAIMLHGRGKVDGMIPGLISLAAAYLLVNDAIETPAFLVYALEVILNALHYNPVIALNVLEHNGWTEGLFTRLMQSVGKFARVNDKKLLILGLTSVMSVPVNQLPPSLQSGLPQLFDGVLQTFRSLSTAIEARDAMERMYEGADSDDDSLDGEFEWDGGEEEDLDNLPQGDDDDVDDLENEYLKQLSSQAAKALDGEDDEDDDGGFGSDDDLDGELEEEFSLETPLDHINAYVYLQEKLNEMQSTNTAAYNVVVQSLNPESTQFLQSLFEEANKQRAEEQQKQQQQ
ncbi:Nonsense-mediated mRNA decay protein 5 [Coemansia sp. Benny D115]|nr:Nonsense-mediated mRNA decay protein 5 [Coemansia sp. Benny D115]